MNESPHVCLPSVTSASPPEQIRQADPFHTDPNPIIRRTLSPDLPKSLKTSLEQQQQQCIAASDQNLVAGDPPRRPAVLAAATPSLPCHPATSFSRRRQNPNSDDASLLTRPAPRRRREGERPSAGGGRSSWNRAARHRAAWIHARVPSLQERHWRRASQDHRSYGKNVCACRPPSVQD